jgi:class 3 adenylate cyclase/tetratricopeptide (TPR) repeat protein
MWSATMDVGVWLRSLGFAQYEDKFRDNKIDADVLPQLTADDLRDIGVVAVGDRRRLLTAIAALTGAAFSASGAGTEVKSQPAVGPASEASAERRPLTVMFCDLVGSTALSARLDPEDMRAVIARYQRVVAVAVQGEGGFIARFMGDGVVAYFGYPQAHEHDAERATRAGLAVIDAVGKLRSPFRERLRVRVGIATGMAVVGDLTGSGESSERSVVGDTPNIAARLQGLARPDSIVISESTRRLIGDLFELEDLGQQQLKGFEGAVPAFLVLRARSFESRFEALHSDGLTELIGREEELEILARRWAKAKAGEGHVVLISGEPGVGKSRLTIASEERLAAEPHQRMRYFCSAEHVDSAFRPIIAHIARAAGITPEGNTKESLNKLDALLARNKTPAEDVALIADLLSLANDGRHPSIESAPQRRRQKILAALVRQIETLSGHSPALLVLEDAHWADPSTLETFGKLIDVIDRLRALLIVTYRPEFTPPWVGRPQATLLALRRLTRDETLELVLRLVGNKLLPDDLRRDIAERADGVPLYAEEIAKAALEARDDVGAARAVTTASPTAHAVPASLHGPLMARLDRLGAGKEFAQIGAAIGLEFSHQLVVAVAAKNETEVGEALDRLVHAGLASRQGVAPHATYLFKHALIRDAAYGALLREHRRALHAKIANALERASPDIDLNQPEIVARHCVEAGLIERAAFLWGAAGRQSLAGSALVEAVQQLKRALELFESLPGTKELRHNQIELQIALMTALYGVKGYGAPETTAALDRARSLIERSDALGEPVENPLAIFAVLDGLWTANYMAFNGEALLALGKQYVSLAEAQDNVDVKIAATLNPALALCATGFLEAARAQFDHAVALFPSANPDALIALCGFDFRHIGLANRGACLWLLGFPEAALSDCERAIADARSGNHEVTFFITAPVVITVLARLGRCDSAIALADEVESALNEKKLAFFAVNLKLNRAFVLSLMGDESGAIRSILSIEESSREMGLTFLTPFKKIILAEAYARQGQFELARGCVRDALEHIERTKETWTEAEVHRTAGEIALMESAERHADAEAHFQSALDVSRRQKARSLELMAATSLARLRRDQGKRIVARDLLAPIYGWFTEGFNTPALREAKALLDELAS